MEFQQIAYGVDAPIATITLDRPQFHNAQGYQLLDEVDRAFALAGANKSVRVVIVRGNGKHFSTGHDIGTSEQVDYKQSLGAAPGIEEYDQFRKYNLDLLLKWRNFPKPTIAMVHGYCIFAGWMLASAMDIIFASEDAEFLASFFEFMTVPWDVGPRKAKELVFESRFMPAREAERYGLVNRVYPLAELEREAYAFARRIAENNASALRFAKIEINKAQDMQGFTRAVEDSFGDFVAKRHLPGFVEETRMKGERRLVGVDLALRGKRGQRAGQSNV